MCSDAPTDDEIQEFVDGRLNGAARARIAAYLLRDPHQSAKVRDLQNLTKALQDLDRDVLNESVPDRLMDILRNARKGE